MRNIVSLLIIVILCGCNNLKHNLGLVTVAPNEKEVQTVKPLSVPKKFDLPEPSAETILPRVEGLKESTRIETTSNLIERRK
ncbi:MAG: hypothetical protein K0R02_985 [Rickettsiaceae bacterium]|jgi:hypothetical protein|nr:hypothetical protein [Rickettsiaceae bacterium]